MKIFRKKKVITLLLAVLIVMLVLGYFRGWDLYLTKPEVASELAPHIRELESIEKLSRTNAELAEQRMEKLIEKMPNNSLKRMYDLGFKSAVTDVVFYGKVIDQYGVAVGNANVSYLITGQFLAAGSGRGNAITDEQGAFYIKGEGHGITIQAITQPQINFNPPITERERKLLTLSSGRHPGLIIKNWDDYITDSPYIFKAWRVEKFENVKKGASYGEPLVPDGRVYTYDFMQFRDWRKRIAEGETQGHLRVSCERAEMQGLRDFQDWRITLTPVNGGIQPTEDIYQNLAPETGYLPSITIEQRIESPEYQDYILNQRYFFTTDNGTTYGSLFIHYYPHGDDCEVAISFKMNLEGSRNLAVKEGG